jgi:uncharacterized membrane protein YfcA
LITGTMIGMVGVGGVLLAPFLFYVLGIDLHAATAMSSWSFLFTGIVGTITYWRRGSISWRLVKWLSLGIIPGALLGAAANSALSSDWLALVLAILILASGANTLLSRPSVEREAAAFSRGVLIALGLLTGFGSALTGTGGPVLLVPVLMFLKMPALLAIAASQVAQLPVATFASLGNALFGEVDFVLGTILGLIQSLGVIVGARIAHTVKPAQLRRFLALALIGVAFLMMGRLVF